MAVNKNKTVLKYTKERVLFSDVLPYEVPLIFSNRFLYNFIVANEIEIQGSVLKWSENISDEDFEVLKFLFFLGDCNIVEKKAKSVKIDDKLITVPFIYKIAHKDDAFRELAVIHPINQLNVVDFYDTQRSLILYFCSISNFSVRHPAKMASYYFYKDRLHSKLLGQKVDEKEEFMKEYENLKSYFSYKQHSQIYKFYEGERYQTAEKKYKKQCRLDIQSCFDSIYTHSISWATLGDKTLYKHFYLNKTGSGDDFGVRFDNLMQRMNQNETNGILIGPEFSRIFAEVILQHIDKIVERQMIESGYLNGRDYECYRYVDDYFVYYNDDNVKDKMHECFSCVLHEYKMSFNQSKIEINERPFITGVSIAKDKIDELLKAKLRIDFSSGRLPIDDSEDDLEVNKINEGDTTEFDLGKLNDYLDEDISLFFKHTIFNMKYKIIINESGVKYRDIINYTLSRMQTRLERLLGRFDDRFKYLSYYVSNSEFISDAGTLSKCIDKKREYELLLVEFISAVLDSVFFIYSNNKRINTTLKIVGILNVIILYLRNNYDTKKDGKFIRFQYSSIDAIFRKIQSEIILSLETSCSNINTQLESLYLLLPIKELGDEYNIPVEVIDRCVSYCDKNGLPEKTNSFVLLLLVYYMGGANEYKSRVNHIKKNILAKIERVHKEDRRRNTEIIILVMDLLTCPIFDSRFKNKLLTLLGVNDTNVRKKIIAASERQGTWFVKWKDFDLNSELSAKISQEVYS